MNSLNLVPVSITANNPTFTAHRTTTTINVRQELYDSRTVTRIFGPVGRRPPHIIGCDHNHKGKQVC